MQLDEAVEVLGEGGGRGVHEPVSPRLLHEPPGLATDLVAELPWETGQVLVEGRGQRQERRHGVLRHLDRQAARRGGVVQPLQPR